MRASVRRWIGERKAAERIARSRVVRAAAALDESVRLAEDQAKIADYTVTGLVKKLPTRPASAPPIIKIRAALDAGRPVEFRRGGRTLVFSGSTDVKRPVHDEGGLPRRRHNRRSPPRNQTPR
jgi:hypothetical protein